MNKALTDYDGEDIEGALINISVALPQLIDRQALGEWASGLRQIWKLHE